MSYRLHGGFRQFTEKLGGLLRPVSSLSGGTPRLRGKLRRAVVVPAPDRLFSEAVFILRDEALHEPGLSRDELLREAARAAEHYTAEVLPPRETPRLPAAAAFLLGSAATLLALWALGLLA